MLNTLISVCICSSCNNNIYPLVHGGYYENSNSTNIDAYPYCASYALEIKKIYVYSNEDLLILYGATVYNLPPEYSNYTSVGNWILIRTDSMTGKTVWSKNIFYLYQQFAIGVSYVYLRDDYTWWLLFSYQNFIYITIISKIDINGEIIDSFSILYDPTS